MLFPYQYKKSQRIALVLSQVCVLIGLSLSSLGISSAFAEGRNATIKKASISHNKNQVAVLNFTFDKPVKYKVFTLSSPDRIVIDLDGTSDRVNVIGKKPAFLRKLRHAKRNTNDLRIVLDMQQSIKPKVSMKGRQLSVFLQTEAAKKVAVLASKNKKPSRKRVKDRNQQKKKVLKPIKSAPAVVPSRPRAGDFIVALDAGHGGKDPGAIGAHGTMEKTVVLQIAKRLKARIDKTRGMKAVLIRNGDYYVPLRERMEIARNYKADLFISIHADANPNRRLTGSSVYILSQNGASSEAARWLASNENSYESRLAGTTLDGKDNTLASMLMDLSQAATIDSSLTLANKTLKELGRVTRLLHRDVESAAFVVLKSPDIPSILVETAFISNPDEEKRLRTSYYQNKLTNAIFNGINGYKIAHAPGGRLKMYASNSRNTASMKLSVRQSAHVVRPGESLSLIAEKYGVKQNVLSDHNHLNSSMIRIGQKLYIPTRS